MRATEARRGRVKAWRPVVWALLWMMGIVAAADPIGAQTATSGIAPGVDSAVEAPAAPEEEGPLHRVEEHRIPSALLGSRKLLLVYLPPGYDPSGATKYPVLYYLHGMGNSARTFFREGIPELTDQMIVSGEIEPLIIASPSGAVSYYVDRHDGTAPYEGHIVHEVINFVEEHYPVPREREGRAIGGVSMGGYGALKIAMRHPELFASVSAHTPFLMKEVPELNGEDRLTRLFMRTMKTLFGDPIDPVLWNENNPFHLATLSDYEDLEIYFNAASRDRFRLYEPGLELHEVMKAEGVEHVFVPLEDVHGWASLRGNWDDVLSFHAQTFTETSDSTPSFAGPAE